MITRHILFALALTAACGPEKNSDDTETGDSTTDASSTATNTTATASEATTTGDATTGGATTGGATNGEPTTGGETTEDPGVDYDALSACVSPMVCEEFIHDAGEAFGHPDNSEGFHDIERCILTGLRDGTPGRYIYGVNSVASNGSDVARTQFIVHAGGEVTFAAHRVSDYFDPGNPDEPGDGPKESYTPAQTCKIVDAAFFDDCFLNHDDLSHFEACMGPNVWWTECVEMGPRCE